MGCDAAGPGPFMLRPDHQDEPIVRYGRAVERAVVHRALDEAEFRRTLVHGRCDLGSVADREPDLDPGMRAPECDQMARQPIAGNGLAGLHRERPALQPPELGEGKLRGLGARQHRLRLGQEQPPRLGQLDAAPNPVEQPDRVARFQRGNGAARRRLRQVQRLRRPRHVLPLGHGDEDTELVEGHGSLPTRCPGSRWSIVPVDALHALVALLGLDAERRDRAGLQALEADRLAGLLAVAVGAVLHAQQRLVYLAD